MWGPTNDSIVKREKLKRKRRTKAWKSKSKEQMLDLFRNKDNVTKAMLYEGVEHLLARHDIYLKDVKEL